jgi:catechol 2,3-dioxygenase-like lactoylglutathione lyase family enzyme
VVVPPSGNDHGRSNAIPIVADTGATNSSPVSERASAAASGKSEECAVTNSAASLDGAVVSEPVPGESVPGGSVPGETAPGQDPVAGDTLVDAVPHIALAVQDTSASAAWWCRTFGFESAEQSTAVPARPRVVIRHPESGLVLGFRQRPEPGRRGRFEYLSLRVASERALGDWAEHLLRLGIPHSSVRDAGDEQFLSLTAPDGIGL